MERSDGYGNYHPLASFDHIAFCETLLDEIVPEAREFINREYDRHASEARPVFAALEELLLLLRDFDEDSRVIVSSTVNQTTAKIGAILGLSLLEGLADQLGIDKDEMYEHWTNVTDLSLTIKDRDRFDSIDNNERAGIILREFMNRGYERMRGLPVVYYGAATKTATALELGEGERASAMRNGFGFVFGAGYEVLGDLRERKQLEELDFDALLPDTSIITTHQEYIANTLRILDRDVDDIEEFLQTIIEENSSIDERIINLTHALALAACVEEGEYEMDETAEAFFAGANLGVHASVSVDADSTKPLFLYRWLESQLHRELAEGGPDYHESTRQRSHKALGKTQRSPSILPYGYAPLFERIEKEQQYTTEELAAFKQGFIYSSATMRKELANDLLGRERSALDGEIEEFVCNEDITGCLQDVQYAFIDHCRALGIYNLDLITADQEKTLLDLMMEDYDRLMPDIASFKLTGMMFVLEIDNDQEESASLMILNEGETVRGELSGFQLALMPCKKNYFNQETAELDESKLAVMPSISLKNASVVLPDGTIHVMTSRFVIGLAVPGVQYGKID